MKNTKTEVRFFTITEWEKEQDYLRQQHQKGWKFVRVNFIGLYHFENANRKTSFISWIITRRDWNTRKSMFRCSATAAGISPGLCGLQLLPESCCPDGWRGGNFLRRRLTGRHDAAGVQRADDPSVHCLFSADPPESLYPVSERLSGRPDSERSVSFAVCHISLYFCLLCSPFPAFLQIPARVTPMLSLSVPRNFCAELSLKIFFGKLLRHPSIENRLRMYPDAHRLRVFIRSVQ